jgi:foldase protein PrsA
MVGAVALAAFGIGFAAGQLAGRSGSAKAGEETAAPADSVAATVGDLTIMESQVTQYVEDNMRVDSSTGETMSDADWVSYLESNGWTPETAREAVIRNVFAAAAVIVSAAAETGIEPDQDEIQTQLEEQIASVGEDGWEGWLTENGYSSEDAFVLDLKASAVYEDLIAAEAQAPEATQAEIDSYTESNASVYAGQRVSAIYLPYGEEADGNDSAGTARGKAESALARVGDGEDFATVADEVNGSGLTGEGGDLGWGNAGSLPEVCTTALGGMAVGDVSGILDDGSAYYILKATEEYVLPEDGTVDLAAVPESLQVKLAEELAASNQDTAESNYYEALLQSGMVTINPMPEGLPYDVDMSAASGES